MTKSLLLFAGFLLFSSPYLFGQDPSVYSLPDSNVYKVNKVKTMTVVDPQDCKHELVSHFDTNGILVRVEKVYADREILKSGFADGKGALGDTVRSISTYTEMTYWRGNKIYEVEFFPFDEAPIGDTTFFRYDGNKLIEVENDYYQSWFIWDEKGDCIGFRMKQKDGDTSIYVETYTSEGGKRVKAICGVNSLPFEITYTYDKKGRLIKRSLEFAAGGMTEYNYEYNKSGMLIREAFYAPEGSFKIDDIRNYSYTYY